MNNNETDKISTISGYISNNKGRSLAGVNIKCDNMDTITLFNGYFKYQVEPGNHRINIEFEGYVEQGIEVFVEEGEEKKIDFILEEEIGESRIYGFVIDKETGKKTVNGSVILIQTLINKTSKIDPIKGLYQFNNLPSGNYTIWTSIIQYKDDKQIINIGNNEEKRYDLYVEKKEEEEVPWG